MQRSVRREGMRRSVKPHINGPALAVMAVFALALAALSFGASIWVAASTFMGSQWAILQALFLAFGVLSVLLALGSTWGAWFWFRLDRRREAAARGNSAHISLASEQPSPRTVPLSLPVIIGIRAKKSMKLVVWSMVALIVLVVSAVAAAVNQGIGNNQFFSTLLGVVAVSSGVALLFTRGSQLEVASDSLKVHVGGALQTVRWEEARLFAITRGRHANVSYELASSQATVPWVWLHPDTFWAHLFEPIIPQHEYDQQMEALLGLIAAKTGLPLYDLR